MRSPLRRLADQVGIHEDRQAHAAGADVADRERQLARQSLLDRQISLVSKRRNEVGIKSVEALRTEFGGTNHAGGRPAARMKRSRQRRTRRQKRHIGILQEARRVGNRGASRSSPGPAAILAARVVVVDLDHAVLDAHRVVGAALV